MKKILLFACLALLLCTTMPVSATYPIETKSISTAHSIYSGQPDDYLYFVTVDSAGTNVRLFDAYTGSNQIVLRSHDNRLHVAMLGSDKKYYYITNVGGTQFLVQVDYTKTPRWYNGEVILDGQSQPVNINIFSNNGAGGDIRVIDSGVEPSAIPREYNGYIYYFKGNILTRIKIGQNIPQTAYTLSTESESYIQSFDLYGDQMLYVVARPSYSQPYTYFRHINLTTGTVTTLFQHGWSGSSGGAKNIGTDVQFISSTTAYFAHYVDIVTTSSGFRKVDFSNLASPQWTTAGTSPTNTNARFRASYLTDIGLRAQGTNLVAFMTSDVPFNPVPPHAPITNTNPVVSWQNATYSPGDTATITYRLTNPDYDQFT
jgi:hypothetical protein